MIPRAARRRNGLQQQLQRSIELLSLPWLCPAALRLHSQSTRLAPAISVHERPCRPSLQTTRNLATTTDSPIVDHGGYIPFEGAPYTASTNHNSSNSWITPPFSTNGSELDTSSLIIMDDLLQTKPKIFRKINGIGGDAAEMLANLDASMKVGRFDRAASLLHRLAEFYPYHSLEYLQLHNRYLQSMVSHIIITRQNDLVWALQKWFEVDMPRGGVRPNATTYAVMIRMALRMLHGPKRDRTVRRYWEMAKNASIEEEVLALPILSELELGQLSEVCATDLQRVAIGSIAENPVHHLPSSPEGIEAYEPLPIHPVKQKGHGLASLMRSLLLFSDESSIQISSDPNIPNAEKARRYQYLRQQQLETDVVQSAIDRWHKEFKEMTDARIDVTGGGKKLGCIIAEWHFGLVNKIEEELKKVAEADKVKKTQSIDQRERREYGVFLQCMIPERLSALTILNVIQLFSRAGVEKGLKLASLATVLGKEVQEEVIADEILCKSKHNKAQTQTQKMMIKSVETRKQRAGRGRWRALVRQAEESDPTIIWPVSVAAKVGAVLMTLLLDVAKVPVIMVHPETQQEVTSMQPAFQHSYRIEKGVRVGVIHTHSEVSKRLLREPPGDILARHLPMVVEPKPWMGFREGGYLGHKSQIMRVTPGDIQQEPHVKAALQNGGLEDIRAGLDVLGKTPWVINQEVFDVMLEAWNSGESVANLPPENPDLPHPPKPCDEDPAAQRKWRRAVQEIENKRAGLHSTRCFQNFQMEVARSYRNETFYLPHNMDFRGRAYPLPPYLNQMGADNSRGLLLFKEAKPLSPSGLRWLKIHLSNVFGFDKASLREREEFAMQHLDDVLDSANKGLHGRRWFLQAEDPWQCLAACCELRNAFRLPNPTQYASRLPIHQDGSCNGLQHYAALGGDIDGAKQVNLEPSDRPSDVYTGVAEFVKKTIEREAAEGEEMARILDGKIKRKIVKQTVMTNVYGVTFIGAIRQVRRQLVDHYPDLPHMTKCAAYIARKIFNALGSMFGGAHYIQYWLGDSATRIIQSLSPEQIDSLSKHAFTPSPRKRSSAFRTSPKENDPTSKFRATVIWTTPLGLPVVQPYRSVKSRRIYTSLQDLSIANPSVEDTVTKRKQLQAFPPNFIHSLDATHMILSANECHRRGMTFSAVHDSFWTHACDIDSMNSILRDTFVCMHSDDIIKRLAAEFEARYGKNIFLANVKSSSPIGMAIVSHRRNTTSNKFYKRPELFAEHKRQTLLQSDDPELQAQGRTMVTPASIFELMNGANRDLAVSSSLGETAIGKIPTDISSAKRSAFDANIDGEDPALSSLFSEFDPQLSTGTLDDPELDHSPIKEHEDHGVEKKKSAKLVSLWLPMKFREVPLKGEFDVHRIKSSEYFFS